MKDKFKLISNHDYIQNLFKKALGKIDKIPVSIYQSEIYFPAEMVVNIFDETNIEICLLNNNLRLKDTEGVEVTFFYKDIYFMFISKIILSNESYYTLLTPNVIYTGIQRLVTRYRVASDQKLFMCANLKDKETKYFAIIDISTKGLSFICENGDFEVGRTLRNIIIKINNRNLICLKSVIKYRRNNEKYGFIYGLAFLEIEWSCVNELFKYIFSNIHSNLKSLNEFAVNEVTDLYNESRYETIQTKNEMEAQFINIIKKIGNNPNTLNISDSLVYYKDNLPLMVGSFLRIYNRTFLGQQLLSLQDIDLSQYSKMEIYLGLADMLLCNPSFEYYISYAFSDLNWHFDMYSAMDKVINNKSKFSFDLLHLFHFNISDFLGIELEGGYEISILDIPEEFIEFCKKNMLPIEINAYNYGDDKFYLHEIREIYEKFGLYIIRRLCCVLKNDEPIAYIVIESGTDGINVNNFNDVCRIYTKDKTANLSIIIKTILPECIIFYSKYRKERFNICFNSYNSDVFIDIPGLKYVSLLARVIMNRKGLVEYSKYQSLNIEISKSEENEQSVDSDQKKIFHDNINDVGILAKIYELTTLNSINKVLE